MANGGVASTVRDIDIVVLSDGCAAFTREVHDTAIAALRPVSRIATIAEMLSEVSA